jgi:alpha-galactosidase
VNSEFRATPVTRGARTRALLSFVTVALVLPLQLMARDTAAPPAGTWMSELTPTAPDRQWLTLSNRGDSWTGTMTSRFGTIELNNIVVHENAVSFSEVLEQGSFAPVRVEGIVKGEDLVLQVDGYRYGFITRVMHRASGNDGGSAEKHVGTEHLKPTSDNGLARTPPMGWNSWNHFGTEIDDKTVREIADAIVKSGLRDAGYTFINLDDGWQGERDSSGRIRANARFPDMRQLAQYLHERGLKLGIYSTPGVQSCAGFTGSYRHERDDAKSFAEWGVDYLKYDWCSARYIYSTPGEMQAAYQLMGDALQASGRPIVYSLCQYGMFDVGRWARTTGANLWRTTGDIGDYWARMQEIGFAQNGREIDAGPGGWNDPDMLEVGNGGMNESEYRTHLTLWATLSAPLLLGNDVRAMNSDTVRLLTNRDVIAVDQDVLGSQGHRIWDSGGIELWGKSLSDGTIAIGIFNRSDVPSDVRVPWSDMGVPSPSEVRDLWLRAEVDVKPEGYQATLPPHGAALLRVSTWPRSSQ